MTALPDHALSFKPMSLEEMRNLRNLHSPFPTVIPQGITLVSYNDFQTSSAIAFFDENDDRVDADKDSDEHDGLGIVVVQLPSHAKPDASGFIGKRRKKRKAQHALSGDVRRPWWEVWEDHESVRKKLYDHRLAASERLLLAAHDFKEGRLGVWPQPGSGVQNLWDQFKMYLGLPLSRDSIQTKFKDRPMYEDDEDDDDGFPDIDMSSIAPCPTSPRLIELGLCDPKTELFLEDPGKSMKVFFSSHFHKQGNIYNAQNCLVFPKLVHFFLSYLIRSKVFPEKRTSNALRLAVTVTELASRELPLTSEIAKTFPDDVNKAFRTLWGPRRLTATEKDEQDKDIAQDVQKQEELHDRIRRDAEEAESVRMKQLEEDRERQAKEDRERAEALARREAAAAAAVAVAAAEAAAKAEAEADSDDTEIQPVEEKAVDEETFFGWGDGTLDAESWGGGTSNGWGSSEGTWGSSGGGWNPTQDDDPWLSNESIGWGAPIVTEQIIDTTTVSTWAPPTLLPSLGATALPLTHRTGVVERSTRRIKDVLWPVDRKAYKTSIGPSAESVEEELIVKFARVVLEPWPDTSAFGPPYILPSSHGKVDLTPTPTSGITGHAPLRDAITVLVHPDSVTLLQNAVGMGLGATWTQIKRIEVVDGKKVKTKGAKDLWYMEELTQQVPSFWTEAKEGDAQ